MPTGYATITANGYTVTMPRVVYTFTPTGSGVNRYVDYANGDDLWTGLLAAPNEGLTDGPYRTIAKAVSVANPGDVLNLRGNANHICEGLTINRSGTDADKIVLQSYPGESAVLMPTASYAIAHPSAATVNVNGRNYWIFHDLTIYGYKGLPGVPTTDHTGANGISFSQTSSYCAVLNCTFLNYSHCGIKAMHQSTGNRYLMIEGNVIYNGGNSNKDHHIYIAGDHCTIRGNVCLPANTGWGIHVYTGTGDAPSNVIYDNICIGMKYYGVLVDSPSNLVAHNVVYQCGFAGTGGGIELYADLIGGVRYQNCHDNSFVSNVAYLNYNGPGTGELDFRTDGISGSNWPAVYNEIDYNVTKQGNNSSYYNAAQGAHEINQIPLFETLDDTGKIYDFRLTAASPGYTGAKAITIPSEGYWPGVAAAQSSCGLFGADQYLPLFGGPLVEEFTFTGNLSGAGALGSVVESLDLGGVARGVAGGSFIPGVDVLTFLGDMAGTGVMASVADAIDTLAGAGSGRGEVLLFPAFDAGTLPYQVWGKYTGGEVPLLADATDAPAFAQAIAAPQVKLKVQTTRRCRVLVAFKR